MCGGRLQHTGIVDVLEGVETHLPCGGSEHYQISWNVVSFLVHEVSSLLLGGYGTYSRD